MFSSQDAKLPEGRYARYPSLAGRAVLITGGATGIGSSMVAHFAAQGARVAFLDRDADAGASLADACSGMSERPHFTACDVTDTDALRQAIAAARARIGPIEVLVNNAANDARHDTADVTPASFDAGIAVNLRHQFFAAQAVMDDMKKAADGSIVNLGSICWLLKNSEYPVYAIGKSAVQGLTRSLARELGPFGIRVNSLLPGWVMTERQRALWLDETGREARQRGQCLAAELMPADLARMALFLAADDSRMITAQDVVVDGGWA